MKLYVNNNFVHVAEKYQGLLWWHILGARSSTIVGVDVVYTTNKTTVDVGIVIPLSTVPFKFSRRLGHGV